MSIRDVGQQSQKARVDDDSRPPLEWRAEEGSDAKRPRELTKKEVQIMLGASQFLKEQNIMFPSQVNQFVLFLTSAS